MLNYTLPILAVSRVTSFLLNALSLVVIVGSILLIATLINKRITKKEEEAKNKDAGKNED